MVFCAATVCAIWPSAKGAMLATIATRTGVRNFMGTSANKRRATSGSRKHNAARTDVRGKQRACVSSSAMSRPVSNVPSRSARSWRIFVGPLPLRLALLSIGWREELPLTLRAGNGRGDPWRHPDAARRSAAIFNPEETAT